MIFILFIFYKTSNFIKTSIRLYYYSYKILIGKIAIYLSIKDAIKIALLNKEYNYIWKHINYAHVVNYQYLDVIRKNKNIKFSYE